MAEKGSLPASATFAEDGNKFPGAMDSTESDPEQSSVIMSSTDGWTAPEEATARLKVDLAFLPIVILAFFALQMDRGNISIALTSTILKDLKITTDQINIGTDLFNVGIIIMELPSNILLKKVGPLYWLSAQVILFGLVATLQGLITSYNAFLATRFLLGVFEAGFVPGALFYLSTWYKNSELSVRVALFFFGQNFASATSSLIGAGILTLEGKRGVSGWQWVWYIEGAISIFIGILFLLLVPPAVGNGKALIFMGRGSYFTERESFIIRNRLLVDDAGKEQGQIQRRDLVEAFTNPRIWVHCFISIMCTAPATGISFYTPLIVKSFGFTSVKASALSSVGSYCGMALNILLAFFCDKTGHRGPFVLVAATWNLISFACMFTIHTLKSKWHRYAIQMVALSGYSTIHVLNVGWLAVHLKSQKQRNIGSALIIISAGLGGLSGANLFQKKDAPNYLHGITYVVAIVAGNWILIFALGLYYVYESKYLRN